MKQTRLNIVTKTEKYPIIIGSNLTSSVSKIFKSNSIDFDKCLIVVDKNVPKKFVSNIKQSLKNKSIFVLFFNASEKNKNINSVNKILEILLNKNFSRNDVLISLGGGITGDVSGFAASLFKRGLKFANIPTTLLAQVDSSVGGKTAINIKQGKNLVGSFYNPIQVLISTKYLESLPDHEYKSGMGEVVKYALIGNKKLNKYMQLNSDAIKKKKLNALEYIIEESIKSKAKIVTSDEKEKGIRAILNFGHTFGHAIEALEKYKGITHGAAVTLGMIIAGKISFYEGHIRSHQLDNMINLIESLGLNTNYSKYKFNDLKKYILNDKKVSEGKLNLILINQSGSAFITNKYNSRNLKKAFD